MQLRTLVLIDQETIQEGGRAVEPPTRNVVACAVFRNPLAGQPARDDLSELVDLSVEVGRVLAERAHRALGGQYPTGYGKAAIVGTNGDLEHGAAMIHVRLGLAMRGVIGGGKALIPGLTKVGGPGTRIDLVFGGVDDAYDYDAMDTLEVGVPGAPRPDEIVLCVGFAVGGRANARVRGASAAQIAAAAAAAST
jgi:hypothetical protein